MTDENIDEIFRLTAAAFGGGQTEIMVHAFPFRMSLAALAKRKSHPWTIFWKNLKPVYDDFEKTRIPPAVNLCGRQYGLKQTQASKRTAPSSKHRPRLRPGNAAHWPVPQGPKPRINVSVQFETPELQKMAFPAKAHSRPQRHGQSPQSQTNSAALINSALRGRAEKI